MNGSVFSFFSDWMNNVPEISSEVMSGFDNFVVSKMDHVFDELNFRITSEDISIGISRN